MSLNYSSSIQIESDLMNVERDEQHNYIVNVVGPRGATKYRTQVSRADLWQFIKDCEDMLNETEEIYGRL